MRIKHVSTKIFILFSGLIALCALAFFFFFNSLVRNVHIAIIEREIAEKARMTEYFIYSKTHFNPLSPDEMHALSKEFSDLYKLRLTIVDLAGKVLGDSSLDEKIADNHLWRKEIQEAIKDGTGKSMRYSNSLHMDMLYFAKKAGPFVIRLAKPLEEIDESVAQVRKTVLIFTVVLFGFAMLMVVGLSRVITNPINESIDFAWGFAKGDLGRRIINYNDDEIGRLQSALNSLADALQDKINGFLLEQNKLAATVQSIHEGIALIDTRKRIVLHNRAFSSFLTIDQEILDRNYYEAIRSSSLNAKIEYALSSSVPCSFEEELRSGITCEIYITPISGEHELNGVLIVLHDVTERKRIVKLKTELVGNLSHELKTPITILKGYLETLRENRCDKDTIGELIDKALASVERQNSIINDMLKLNMLETTRAFQDEDVDLRDVIENCLNILTPKVREKRIVVAAQLDALPGAIRANRFLAEEILFNIIDNGINYNRDDGSLTIVAQLQHRRLALEISDTGIGIPPESLDRVFERFYRVNKSRSRATGGTGLGLSIVKHAAELIAWQISVKSTESGSTFTIEIPIEE